MGQDAQRMHTETLLAVGKVVSIEVIERLQRHLGEGGSLFVVDARPACETRPPSRYSQALDKIRLLEKVKVALVEETHFGERLRTEEEARPRQARCIVEIAR